MSERYSPPVIGLKRVALMQGEIFPSVRISLVKPVGAVKMPGKLAL
tara:strand:+ start:395 stop:532 length:138 start_codon:yes stop_codon:yes gene_type:complete